MQELDYESNQALQMHMRECLWPSWLMVDDCGGVALKKKRTCVCSKPAIEVSTVWPVGYLKDTKK